MELQVATFAKSFKKNLIKPFSVYSLQKHDTVA